MVGDRNHSGPENTCQDIVISAHATLLSMLIFILLGIPVKKGEGWGFPGSGGAMAPAG